MNEKEYKRVRGVVDRIENGIVVVVVENQDNGSADEIYVPVSQFKNKNIQEGDVVTVYI